MSVITIGRQPGFYHHISFKVLIFGIMKKISILITLLCIGIPPLAYLFSLQIAENYFAGRFERELQGRYRGDVHRLMDGSIRLKEAVNNNIEAFLNQSTLVRLGVYPRITVTAKKGEVLYPAEPESSSFHTSGLDRMKIASENMQLLNQGLQLRVHLKIGHRSLFAIFLLAFWIVTASVGFLLFQFHNAKRFRTETAQQAEHIKSLDVLRNLALERLSIATEDRQALEDQVAKLRQELTAVKENAHRTEDDLFGELVGLEERLNQNLLSQQQQEQLIISLQEQIQKYDQQADKDQKQKMKATEMVAKRFAVIYKSLRIHKYAIEGYVELTDEMQIRAEEILQILHTDPGKISIKRKVFGNKSSVTAFEVLFGYKGRLYYRTSDQRIEVLAIGTKNTQLKDLAFLKRI